MRQGADKDDDKVKDHNGNWEAYKLERGEEAWILKTHSALR